MSNSKQLSPKIYIKAEMFHEKSAETSLLWHVRTHHWFTTFIKPVDVTYTKNPLYNHIKSYEATFKNKHNSFYEEVFFV